MARTAFNVVKSGVAGGLGFYTRICCEIDNMPTWAKAAVGTTGIIIAGASGVGAAAIAETVIASAGISAATDGAFYSIYALNNGSFQQIRIKGHGHKRSSKRLHVCRSRAWSGRNTKCCKEWKTSRVYGR